MLLDEKITQEIIAAAIEVHRELGPGLLESANQECLCRELETRGVAFRREVPLPLVFKGLKLDCGYRMDLVVGDRVVVGIKACEGTSPLHEAQLLTYLRLSGKRTGLLINFNVRLLKDGILRRVL